METGGQKPLTFLKLDTDMRLEGSRVRTPESEWGGAGGRNISCEGGGAGGVDSSVLR